MLGGVAYILVFGIPVLILEMAACRTESKPEYLGGRYGAMGTHDFGLCACLP